MPNCPIALDATTGDEIGAALSEVLERARRAWPAFTVDPEAFAHHLRSCLGADAEFVDAVRRLHVEDLYLAFACALRDEQALCVFDREKLQPLPAKVLRPHASPQVVDEVLQMLRVMLMVGTANGGPRILQYRGSGSLKAWLAICATRLMIRHQNTTVPTEELDDRLAAPLSESGDMAYLKGRYRDVFNRAISAALGELTARDRALLHQYYAIGTSMDRLGTIYGVSRATAARRVARARARLVAAVRQRVVAALDIAPEAAESILRSIRSAIELSLSRLQGIEAC